MSNEKQDVYTRITDKIVADLEQGVRTWMKPWNASHTSGRITRPLRHNGQPYNGINILILWASAIEQGFTASRWMTFAQALEWKGHVRKGEKGSLVVYANSIVKTEQRKAERVANLQQARVELIAPACRTCLRVVPLEILSNELPFPCWAKAFIFLS